MPTSTSYATLANYALNAAQANANFAYNSAATNSSTADVLKNLAISNQSNAAADSATFAALMNANESQHQELVNLQDDMAVLKKEMADVSSTMDDFLTMSLEKMMLDADTSLSGAGGSELSGASINAMFGFGGND